MVSEKDRKAYEKGEKEAEFIKEHPGLFIIGGGKYDRPSDPSEREAYDKGLRGEQLDEDKK